MEHRRRFRILKELAEGAFGKVYLAEMITGDRFKSVVAIKLLHGKWLGHQEIVQRSRDEARVLGLLHHRNIVRVEDLTSINGQCAVIMEYLEGVDLKSLVRHCRERSLVVPMRVAFEVIASTASALHAAFHQNTLNSGKPLKLIHRDIKPSNVMLTGAGEVKVLDFGTARAQFEDREAETQALAFGSAAYMSPERLMGDPDAPAGDVFALGITLYELLRLKPFGKIYIREEKFEEALDHRIDGIDLSGLAEDKAALVRSTLRLLLAYDAAERPNAGEIVELMEALAEQVQDGSVRKFCREVVAPCHQAMEYPDNPDDPFMGSTLFEDTTRVREEASEDSGLKDLGVGPTPTLESATTFDTSALPAPQVGQVVTADALPTVTNDLDDGGPPTEEMPYPELVDQRLPDLETEIADGQQIAEALAVAGISAPAGAASAPPTQRSGLLIGVLVALFVMILGGAGLVGLKVFLTPDVVEPIEIPEVRSYAPGGNVDAGYDGRTGVLVLGLQGAGDARVSISGNQNDYNYRWDGTGELRIKHLQPGVYRIRIVNGTQRLNLESKVLRRRTCSYEYNMGSEKQRWTEEGCS